MRSFEPGVPLRPSLMFAWLTFAAPAMAQDAFLSQQGRLMNAAGDPYNGSLDVRVTLYSDASGTSDVWRKTYPATAFQNGYYGIGLTGDDDSSPARPLDDALHGPLWLGIAIDGGAELAPLSRVSSIVENSLSANGPLVVQGSVTFSNSTVSTCTSANDGELRWTGTNFEGCTGTAWVVLARGGAGQNQDSPVQSCQALRTANPSATSGPYWIDPDGALPVLPFRTWCEISGTEGWTLIETVNAGFNLNATYWSPAAINPDTLDEFNTNPNTTARLAADQINVLCRSGAGEVRHRYGNNAQYVTDVFDSSILPFLDIAYALRGDSTYHMGFRAFGNGSATVTSGGPWRRYNGPRESNIYCTGIHSYCGGSGTAYNGWGPLCDSYGCNGAPGQGRGVEGNFWWAGSNSGNGVPSATSAGTYGSYGSRWCR